MRAEKGFKWRAILLSDSEFLTCTFQNCRLYIYIYIIYIKSIYRLFIADTRKHKGFTVFNSVIICSKWDFSWWTKQKVVDQLRIWSQSKIWSHFLNLVFIVYFSCWKKSLLLLFWCFIKSLVSKWGSPEAPNRKMINS